MPNPPPELPAEVPVQAPVPPEAVDTVLAANRAVREQLVEALGTMEGLSSRGLGAVRVRNNDEKVFDDLDIEFLHMITYRCSKVKSMALLCTTILRMMETVVKLRGDIAKYRTACKLATAKAEAEIGQLKIRELIEQIKAAMIELDEKIQSLMKEKEEDSSPDVARQAAADKHLDEEIRAWRKTVAGFEARAERLREETRDEMDEIAEERAGKVFGA